MASDGGAATYTITVQYGTTREIWPTNSRLETDVTQSQTTRNELRTTFVFAGTPTQQRRHMVWSNYMRLGPTSAVRNTARVAAVDDQCCSQRVTRRNRVASYYSPHATCVASNGNPPIAKNIKPSVSVAAANTAVSTRIQSGGGTDVWTVVDLFCYQAFIWWNTLFQVDMLITIKIPPKYSSRKWCRSCGRRCIALYHPYYFREFGRGSGSRDYFFTYVAQLCR